MKRVDERTRVESVGVELVLPSASRVGRLFNARQSLLLERAVDFLGALDKTAQFWEQVFKRAARVKGKGAWCALPLQLLRMERKRRGRGLRGPSLLFMRLLLLAVRNHTELSGRRRLVGRHGECFGAILVAVRAVIVLN